MKKLSLIVLIVICHSLQSLTQNYTPMVVDHARWIYDGYGDLNEERFGFEILGDTIINNTSYKKVYHLQVNSGPYESPIIVEYKALIAVLREDINTKKVYCIALNYITQLSIEEPCLNEMSNGEYLLYDYDLIVGDTLNTCLSQANDPAFENIIVESITQEPYNGYMLTSYNCSLDIHLIEGIGFDNGLFQSLVQFISAAKGYFLSTYCREVNVNDCTELSNENIPWNELSIYPNPMDDVVSINAELPFSSIEIYDYTGKLHSAEHLESNTSFNMDVSHLLPGMYLLKIANQRNEYAFYKMVKH